MENKEIKRISPSSFYYLEKCPLSAVFAHQYKNCQIFPKHPDSDLGTIIHQFYENREKWEIKSKLLFEVKWDELVQNVDNLYKSNPLQMVYYPLKWNSSFYAVKKQLLRKNLLAEKPKHLTDTDVKMAFEQWITDVENNVGGFVDLLVHNHSGEVIEVVDFKTGNIFEFVDKQRRIKEAYLYQLSLYVKIIFDKQSLFPKATIQDMNGKKHLLNIDEEYVNGIYKKAIKLKELINSNIANETIDNLAILDSKNCSFCDYRPYCNTYKNVLINNFDSKNIDIHGTVIDIINAKDKVDLVLNINNEEYLLKGVSLSNHLDIGDIVYIFNLFSPDSLSKIFYATKRTIVVQEQIQPEVTPIV